MRKILLLLLLFSGSVFGQSTGFHYKALLTQNGNVMANRNVNLRFTIQDAGAANIYTETHSVNTDANGIVNVTVGEGTVVSGAFNHIDWSMGHLFLKVELDTGSGYRDFGTSEFKYVPYAKYAREAGNAFSGDYNDLTNRPDFTNWDTNVNDDVQSINDLTDAQSANSSLYLGTGSGNAGATGQYNAGMGLYSLSNITDGRLNVAMGYSAMTSLNIGMGNTALGANALNQIQGDGNVAIGMGAGQNNNAGHRNVYIGFMAGRNATGSHKLYIENSDSDTPLIGGDFSTDEVVINGALSIKDGTQGAGKIFTSDADGKGSWQDAPMDADFLVVGSTTPATAIDDDIYHTGRMAIGKNTLETSSTVQDAKLEVQNPSSDGNSPAYVIKSERLNGGNSSATGNMFLYSLYGGSLSFKSVYNKIGGSGDGHVYGQYNDIYNTGSGTHEGVYNIFYMGTGDLIGVHNNITAPNNNIHYGIYNEMSGNGSGRHIGSFNLFSGTGDGEHYGVRNIMLSSGTGPVTGTFNTIDNANTSTTVRHIGTSNIVWAHADNKHFGTSNFINTAGAGDKYGTYNNLVGTGTGDHYGVYNYLDKTSSDMGMQVGSYNYLTGSGTGPKYGVYAKIDENSAGQHMAVYGEATKAGSFAGMFVGNVVVGGNTEVDGKLTSVISGTDNDMKAYAYGEWYNNNPRHISASVTITKNTTNPGEYTIQFPGSLTSGEYIVVANLYRGIGFIKILKSSGSFRIFTYDTSGNPADRDFTFVIYKK